MYVHVLCILFLTTNFYHKAYSVPSLKSECQTDSSREFKWPIGMPLALEKIENVTANSGKINVQQNTTRKVPLTTLFHFLKHNKYTPPSLGVINCKGHK